MLRGGLEMNRFEARARHIATRVSPDFLAGHPDMDLSLSKIAWLRFRRWVLPTLVLVAGLYVLGFRPATPETHRLAAIAEEILGSAQGFDERVARLRLKERLVLITALEKLLVPGAEPGLWPAVARTLGFDAHSLFEEENRFELVSIFIQYISSLPAERQSETMRLALLQALEGADIMRIDQVRVIAELPPDLRKDLAALSQSEFRALFAGLQAHRASAADRQHVLKMVELLKAETERQKKQLEAELAQLHEDSVELNRKIEATKSQTDAVRQRRR